MWTLTHRLSLAYTQAISCTSCRRASGGRKHSVWSSSFVVVRYCSQSSCKLRLMESNTNNISSAGLHGLDQRQRRSDTSEEVDIRQGQNALGSLSLSTDLTPSRATIARSAIVARK